MMTLLGALLLILGLASPSWAAVVDTFNRANEGPPPSSSWTTSWLGSGLIVTTNTLAGNNDAVLVGAYLNGSTYTDADVFLTFVTIDENSFFRTTEIQLRLVNPTNAGTVDGYACRLEVDSVGNGFASRVRIYRIDNGTYTALTDSGAHTFVDGDKFRCAVSGTSLNAYYDTGGGWVGAGSTTDATYSAAGYVGVATDTTSAKLTMDDLDVTGSGGGGGDQTFGFRMRIQP